MSDFMTVRRYARLEEARVAWSLLRSAGIEAVLDHHEACSTLAGLPIGVALRAPVEHAEDAIAAIAYVESGAFTLAEDDEAA